MRDPQRIDELLKLIDILWKKQPDFRFQQLLYLLQSGYSKKNNCVGKIESIEDDGFSRTNYDLFNTEDDASIEYLHEVIKNDF